MYIYYISLFQLQLNKKSGPHLYQTDPSGNFTEYYANTIGARSQATKTYLERHFAKFAKGMTHFYIIITFCNIFMFSKFGSIDCLFPSSFASF